jgi:ketosteroid isomerase-like protein
MVKLIRSEMAQSMSVFLVAVALFLSFGASKAFAEPEEAPAQSTDVQAIQHLISLYAISIDQADTALASQIWSHSPDVSFIDPRGQAHGLNEVEENFYCRTMGDNFSKRKLEIQKASIHVYGDAAWSEFDWVFNGTVKMNGHPKTTKGRETQVYHREQGQWRLVHVHYSGVPTTGDKSF